MDRHDIPHELAGLRGLARALAHGDADDLLQDVAVATLEHPPATDRPVRPWLATVLLNRWRMDRRAAARRTAREQASSPDVLASEPVDRARMLEKLSAALVALDEPFRSTVIRRYLDGESAAAIARALGVPSGTVRWRLKTGLERLRAALDRERHDWRHALVPVSLGALVKTKTKVAICVALAALLAGGAVLVTRRASEPAPPTATVARSPTLPPAPIPHVAPLPIAAPRPGQGRANIEATSAPGGLVHGQVVNWSTGDGVEGAELTFVGDAGAVTVRSLANGAFELAPTAPGRFLLAAAAAPGFLPYAPEHSRVHVAMAADREVRDITVFLIPALDYHGHVVDAAGTPVAGATVKLLGAPANEQAIDPLRSTWTTDGHGEFTFHASDDAVLEATSGTRHGLARLDGKVAISKQLVIKLGIGAARDATITGRVVDAQGAALPDAIVRALPDSQAPRGLPDTQAPRAAVFATAGPDGAFAMTGIDRDSYTISAELEGYAPPTPLEVRGGAHDVTVVLETGATIAGIVTTSDHAPIPAFSVLAYRRAGAGRELVAERSVVDAAGRFELHVAPGNYELIASASGWAPSAPTTAAAGATGVTLVVSAGAILRGVVTSAAGGPVRYARVQREWRGDDGDNSAQPANAGTVTRLDGSFELTGIPPGPLSITIGADSFHPRIEGGMTARDGEELPPLAVALTPLAPGETPSLELVGIGVSLAPDGDTLRVGLVIAGSGAEAAGIVVGDHVVTVDGASVTELGVDGSVAKIRGIAGTTVAIGLQRGEQIVTLAVQRRKLRA